jgi:hypothetical protein
MWVSVGNVAVALLVPLVRHPQLPFLLAVALSLLPRCHSDASPRTALLSANVDCETGCCSFRSLPFSPTPASTVRWTPIVPGTTTSMLVRDTVPPPRTARRCPTAYATEASRSCEDALKEKINALVIYILMQGAEMSSEPETNRA